MFLLIFSLFATAAITTSNENNDWWRDTVFYQIYPRSFKDSDGDGVGDLKGVISKLGYLAETGITATWLSPFFQSPMVDFGYDISNFTAIQAEYGTMDDFDELMKEANRLGIKIILDLVPNHTSDECDWFSKSVKRVEGYVDFYVWEYGKLNEEGALVPPNNWVSVFHGSAWSWNSQRNQYYLHQFAPEQPDLNYRNPLVRDAIDNVMRFWLDKGVAGFRVDAVVHLFEDIQRRDEPLSGATNDSSAYDYTKKIYTRDLPEVLELLQHWYQLLEDYSAAHPDGPRRIMMTEAYADVKILMDYYEDRKGVRGSHFPFNFLFITDVNKESDARDVIFNIQKWLTYMPHGFVANWVMGNHDQPRVASRFGDERVDALHILLMTLPGVAVTYNGEEIGMQDHRGITWDETVDPAAKNSNATHYNTVSRDPVRTPFQWDDSANAGFSNSSRTWLPVHPNYKTLNLAKQQMDPKSHYNIYKKLLELRKMPTFRYGRFSAEVINRDVFSYKRALKDHPTVVVFVNLGPEYHALDYTQLDELPAKLIVIASTSNSTLEADEIISSKELHLMPYEGFVALY